MDGPAGQQRVRLLLADDQGLVRGALVALLDLEPDLEVVAQADRGDDVRALVVEHAVDVCLLDIEMPGMDGLAACADVTARTDARVLIVTTFGRPGHLRRALEAGASGFVVKDTPAAQLADAVRRVHAGLRVVDPALATESLLDGASPLTDREAGLLRLALTGATVKAMAAHEHLSEGTVRNHLSAAIGKTGTSTRVEAAQRALERGWI